MANQSADHVTSLKVFAGDSAPSLEVICFSHLRWDFVFQRPQQLLTRIASRAGVVFWEEPLIGPELDSASLQVRPCGASGVVVVTPQLPAGLDPEQTTAALKQLLDRFVANRSSRLIAWYYTPMMLPFSQHLAADCVVYDCMDELANFRFAPPELLPLEQQLLHRADLVFTGGYSLYEAKRAVTRRCILSRRAWTGRTSSKHGPARPIRRTSRLFPTPGSAITA
jgi:UDP-galactopyranose mutase